MDTITLGNTNYNKVEIPMNIVSLSALKNTRIVCFSMQKHKEGFDYAHGLVDNSEVEENIKAGAALYILESDQSLYDTKLKELLEDMKVVLINNRLTFISMPVGFYSPC